MSIFEREQPSHLHNRHHTPSSKTGTNSMSQDLEGRGMAGQGSKLRLVRITRQTETININYHFGGSGNGTVNVSEGGEDDNGTGLRLSNNQDKFKLLRPQFHSSQKNESNGQFYQLHNRYKIHSNKKSLKTPISLFSATHKASNSVSIPSLDKINNTQESQIEQIKKYPAVGVRFRERAGLGLGLGLGLNSIAKEKYQPYFKRRRQFEDEKGKVETAPYTVSAFDRLETPSQPKDQKQDIQILTVPLNTPALQIESFHGESFKGRRPYNEDRFICQTKNNLNIRQQFQQIQNRVDREREREGGNRYSLFGVFDGHGGAKCSEYLKENFNSVLNGNRNLFMEPQLALKETLAKLEEKFLSICDKGASLETSGSCAVACLIIKGNIYIANVGDSRALLLSSSSVKQVTRDHKPEDKEEKARIIRNGGKLYKDGSVLGALGKENIRIFNQTRIMPGSLNVSRTVGDIEVKYKKYGGSPGIVVAQPQIFVESLSQPFDHLLLASDGLFEGLSNEQIHSVYKTVVNRHQSSKKQPQESLTKSLTKQLIRQASERSNDNITVISVQLPSRLNQF